MLLVGRQAVYPTCKNWVVGCWHGYLSGAWCRLAYGPVMPLPVTVSCFSKIQIGFTFWVVPEKGPLNECVFLHNFGRCNHPPFVLLPAAVIFQIYVHTILMSRVALQQISRKTVRSRSFRIILNCQPPRIASNGCIVMTPNLIHQVSRWMWQTPAICHYTLLKHTQ